MPSKKKFPWIAVLVVALLVLVALAPVFASSPAGSRWVSQKASASVPGTIEIEGLSLSWGAGQSVGSVRILDPQGGEVISVTDVRLPSATLLGLASGPSDPGPIEVANLTVSVVRGADGTSNLERALVDPNAPPSDPPPPPGPVAALFRLRLADGSVTVTDAVSGTTVLSGLTVGPAGQGEESARIQATVERDGAEAPLDVVATVDGGNLALTAPDLPVALVDALAGAEGMLLAALGETASLTVSAPLAGGDVSASVSSPSSHGSLEATVGDTMTLRQDATATLEVTPELGSKILQMINPFLVTALEAEEPVRARLERATFSAPQPFDLETLVLDAEVTVGRVVLGSGGPLEQLLTALGRSAPQRTTAEFTPAVFHVEDGVLTYQRMTMTADQLVVAVEGTVDLAGDSLDMRVVVPRVTFENFFGDLASGLEEGYEMVIPVRGSTTAPQMDFAAVAAEVAKLAASGVLGGVGDLLGGLGGLLP